MFVHFPCVGNVRDSKETKFQNVFKETIKEFFKYAYLTHINNT